MQNKKISISSPTTKENILIFNNFITAFGATEISFERQTAVTTKATVLTDQHFVKISLKYTEYILT